MTKPVVTRFAPSPTGYLHIGGARTALFNWLFAKANGGEMLLRIEDTDRKRYSEEAVDAILGAMNWLGLDYGGAAISQFARAERHREVAEQLLKSGNAYKCFATPEELTEMREAARAAGLPPVYDGRWRDRDPSEAPEGAPYSIRIKTPRTGATVVEDIVQGTVTYDNETLDDFIILRSDGTPTYMHAVVVDDHDMGVTHIIRGDDHLNNAARQLQLYRALDWDVPVFAHIPLIHGADGAKFSKRHGAQRVDEYRNMGFLPEAMRNYLARLSWSHGDQELFTTDELIAVFGLDAIGKSAARFDMSKLESVNAHHIKEMAADALFDLLGQELPHLDEVSAFAGGWSATQSAALQKLMPALQQRSKRLQDLLLNAEFLFLSTPLSYAAPLADDGVRTVLITAADRLGQLTSWVPDSIADCLNELAAELDLKMGKLAKPLREAVTAGTPSPGIFDVLYSLGQDESVSRIKVRAGQ